MTDRLLCWCCAVWGITANAIDGRERLCADCLGHAQARDHVRRHMAQALEAAGG